jgi:hypothetical protein
MSAADTIADGWAAVGAGDPIRDPCPLGRCLQWQAPVAGEMLDEAVAGTFIDKMALQKIVRGRGRFDTLASVLGPPAIVFAIERNPAQAEVLLPMLAASIRSSLPHMVPAIKKARAKEEKMAQAAAELFADDPSYREGTTRWPTSSR